VTHDLKSEIIGLACALVLLVFMHASATPAPPVPGSDCMDASPMSLELHGRGIHAVYEERPEAAGRISDHWSVLAAHGHRKSARVPGVVRSRR
jgi:hypothetical protein